jgi:hypothetical protein
MITKRFLPCINVYPYKSEIKNAIKESNLHKLKLYFGKIRFSKKFRIRFITSLIKYSVIKDSQNIRKYLLSKYEEILINRCN